MTSRVSLPPQDFKRMCKQAERDHEARKLVVLMERVKRQIAERANADDQPKPPMPSTAADALFRLPLRRAPFER
ncbi:MAG TPA: hypothetical protein VMH04_13180 [Candidatus Solibacter sp.]|nr:hypothetical protein [Candidatus Solibacter sp.]